MSPKEAPPWMESPFGKAKLHDNPLFKSSPGDNLSGEEFKENCGDRGDNYKNNSCPGKVSKVVKSSALTKTSSKRVLGERNCSQQQQRLDTYTLDEPPKTIRALSYPSVELFGSSSSCSSSSEEEISPPSRFQVCFSPVRAVSPTRSESSGEADADHDYDPKMNLRTSRPRFLRYRPDWRLEFLNSLELAQGESLLDAIEARKPEEEEESGDRDVLTVVDGFVDSVNGEPATEAGAAEAETGEDVARENVHVEMNARASSSSSGITLRAVSRMVLFGALTGLVFLAMMDWFGELSTRGGFLPSSALSERVDLRDSSPWNGTGPGHHPQDGWEWHPEYDSSEGFSNQTVFELFSTESEELDALLLAIMYGSDEEIQHRYLELMEFENEYEYFDEEELLLEQEALGAGENDANSSIVQSSKREEDNPSSIVEPNRGQLPENSGSFESGDDGLGLVTPIDAVRLHEDLNRLKESLEFLVKVPACFQLALVLTVVLGGFIAGYLFTNSWSSSTPEQAVTPVTPSSNVVKPRTSEDLVISPECFTQSPYGSFTAYKRTVVNEGSANEHIKLTPVRRSSRIQSQHRLEQTPPVKRKILMSPRA